MVPKLCLLDNCNQCNQLESRFHRRLYHISISNHLASKVLHMQVFHYRKYKLEQILVEKAVERMVERMEGNTAERTDC
jgi:hypothetical protein